MKSTGENRQLGEKPVPVPLCPPQTPHGLARDRTRASTVRGRRLTAWAMARPKQILICVVSSSVRTRILRHLSLQWLIPSHTSGFRRGVVQMGWVGCLETSVTNHQPRAVPWLRRLVAGLLLRRPGFDPGSVHVGFMVDKVALGQVFLRVVGFPLSISFHWCSVNCKTW
jgi:hypothetical protein